MGLQRVFSVKPMNQPIEKLSAACDGYDKQSDRVLMWNKINEIIDYLFPDKPMNQPIQDWRKKWKKELDKHSDYKEAMYPFWMEEFIAKVELAARDEGYECGLDQAKSIKLAAYKRGLGKAKYFVEELEVGKDNICLKCCLDIEKKIDQEIEKVEKL